MKVIYGQGKPRLYELADKKTGEIKFIGQLAESARFIQRETHITNHQHGVESEIIHLLDCANRSYGGLTVSTHKTPLKESKKKSFGEVIYGYERPKIHQVLDTFETETRTYYKIMVGGTMENNPDMIWVASTNCYLEVV